MSAAASTFYVTGGTLRPDAPSYVERQADRDLLDGLLKGEFCYVLTSRQMGKSSLMVRTAAKLREQGTHVIALDLTAIGQNLTPEQWYDGLIVRMGRQLRMDDELEDFWKANPELGPCQRLFTAIRDMVLPRLREPSAADPNAAPPLRGGEGGQPSALDSPHTAARLVIFVDELDVVRSLPFSTDEFFAAIRECYNRRTEDPEFHRLTFCLLGVATPGDLIRDTRTTPFNVGRRIELHDFTPEEAAPLAQGLRSDSSLETQDARLLLSRILHWTNGHPYLSQRLCHAIAEGNAHSHSALRAPPSVDKLCAELFFSDRARERDDNLLFVRERLLRAGADHASLLHLYAQAHARKRVRDDETNPLVSILRLSGITRAQHGQLQVRNRIYERVFNRDWVRSNMPDAEVRRQRAAFRKGVVRAASLAAVAVAAMAVLASVAVRQSRKAGEAKTKTEKVAEQLQRTLTRADFATGAELLEKDEFGKGLSYLARSLRTDPTYWPAAVRLLSALTARNYSLDHPQPMATAKPVTGWEANQQGDRVVTLHTDESGRLWDATTSKVLREFGLDKQRLRSAAFSVDGTMLVTITKDSIAQVWDARTGEAITKPLALGTDAAEILTDLRTANETLVAAIRSVDGSLRLRDLRDGTAISPPLRSTGKATKMGFSQDGKLFWGAFDDGSLGFWESRAGNQVGKQIAHKLVEEQIELSPDNESARILGNDNKVVELWNVRTGEPRCTPLRFDYRISEAGFSPDGQRIVLVSATDAAGKAALKAQVLAVETGREVASITEEKHFRYTVDFPHGLLPVYSDEYSLKVWDLATGRLRSTLPRQEKKLRRVVISPEGGRLATVSEDFNVRIWDLQSGQPETEPMKHTANIDELSFSPDGEKLITASDDGVLRVWHTRTGQPLTEPIPMRGFIESVGFAADRRHALVQSFLSVSLAGQRIEVTHGEVSRWTMNPGRALNEPLHHGLAVSQRKFSPDGKKILLLAGSNQSAGEASKAYLLDAATKQSLVEFPHPDDLLDGEVSADGMKLVTIAKDKLARIWDAATGKLLTELKHEKALGDVAVSPDGTRVLTSTKDFTVRIWEVQSGKLLSDSIRHTNRISVVKFSPDGKKIVTAALDKTVRIWDGITGLPVMEPLVHKWILGNVCFSPDGLLLATAPFDRTALVWEAGTGQLLKELTPPFEDRLRDVNFSPDGQKLATTYGGTLDAPAAYACIWNWREGKLLTEPLKHPGVVLSARFSPDGKMLLTACVDGKARLWDVETGRVLMEPIPNERGSPVDYRPDGKQILTSSGTGAALWPLPPRQLPLPDWLPGLAEAIAGRKLGEQGGQEMLSPENLRKMQEQISKLPDKDDYTRYAKWLFADRATRAIAPTEALSLPEYVRNAVQQETLESLREAILLSPTNGLAFARLGRILAASNPMADDAPSLDPHFLKPAMWYARQATNLAPDSAEAWCSLADLLDQVGQTEAAVKAVDNALALDGRDPNASIIKAFILTSRGQTDAANEAYARAKELAASIQDPKTAARMKNWFTPGNLVKRLHNYSEASAANVERRKIPKRHERTKPSLIDLTPFYNAALTQDWGAKGRNLAGLPAGIQTIDGIDFDVRGVIWLNARSDDGEIYPGQVLGIPVGLQAKRLHFLHAADLWGGTSPLRQEGMLIGRYVIHLTDGQEREVPLVVGADYMHWRNKEGTNNIKKNLVTAWKGDSENSRQMGRYVQLFRAVWENPSPQVAVNSIDFISERGRSSPFLVALTAQAEIPPVITQPPTTVTCKSASPPVSPSRRTAPDPSSTSGVSTNRNFTARPTRPWPLST